MLPSSPGKVCFAKQWGDVWLLARDEGRPREQAEGVQRPLVTSGSLCPGREQKLHTQKFSGQLSVWSHSFKDVSLGTQANRWNGGGAGPGGHTPLLLGGGETGSLTRARCHDANFRLLP